MHLCITHVRKEENQVKHFVVNINIVLLKKKYFFRVPCYNINIVVYLPINKCISSKEASKSPI